ncbi:FBP domain-containing protein [Streptomyces sp. NPDC098789]
MCSDLACSLYVPGRKDAGIDGRPHETITLDEKMQRMVVNPSAFLARVTS